MGSGATPFAHEAGAVRNDPGLALGSDPLVPELNIVLQCAGDTVTFLTTAHDNVDGNGTATCRNSGPG
jgi:hypothetical protein